MQQPQQVRNRLRNARVPRRLPRKSVQQRETKSAKESGSRRSGRAKAAPTKAASRDEDSFDEDESESASDSDAPKKKGRGGRAAKGAAGKRSTRPKKRVNYGEIDADSDEASDDE
eukprot:EC720075.1.p2 GENE.EC720075.1~~EC720075.1.p2  ORF type:complete len:115 (+),score=13.61 EC720075.1:106-450(+)